ncbi:hypothetical protein CAOG_03380 [Capsaspora owczarzaki ATCC 30864]|uniref:Kinetochore protein Spc24 n=1 Tax=Capsaspora owczarzaki (strain ATCC 30864) TaxID=595528 RepID=A0A0D2VPI6_CAPO3|nr:hypothetical protein CAOG_03380 [Capsaspora owczarzaki ATCC 30864]KJE92402.1 hypothetical protein CAOG_003380 [Capsaspora owczarzaki ATCC 30864]|eukprot:XP_004364219.2 hypothetical protein CAOG_03380 [Capsaspora owczarzaki ATCC 30864]
MSVTFQTTGELMREATRVFTQGDDVREVSEIMQLQRQVSDIHEQRELASKAAILELTAKLSAEESKCVRATPDNQHAEVLQNIENDKFALAKSINHLDRDNQALTSTMHKLDGDLDAIQARRQAVEQARTVGVPQNKSIVSLYMNITNIKWDFEQDNLVKGFVTKNNDVRPFSLDPKVQTPYFIANYLWEKSM